MGVREFLKHVRVDATLAHSWQSREPQCQKWQSVFTVLWLAGCHSLPLSSPFTPQARLIYAIFIGPCCASILLYSPRKPTSKLAVPGRRIPRAVHGAPPVRSRRLHRPGVRCHPRCKRRTEATRVPGIRQPVSLLKSSLVGKPGLFICLHTAGQTAHPPARPGGPFPGF